MKLTPFHYSVCWTAYCLCFSLPCFLTAQEEEPKAAQKEAPICSKDMLMTFFPQPIVKEVLLKYNLSETQAEQVAKQLSKKNDEVVKIVKQKASQMNPNPLNDLTERDQIIKIFKESVYEILEGVLKDHIQDPKQIQAIQEDIQEAKGKMFVECLSPKKAKKAK